MQISELAIAEMTLTWIVLGKVTREPIQQKYKPNNPIIAWQAFNSRSGHLSQLWKTRSEVWEHTWDQCQWNLDLVVSRTT